MSILLKKILWYRVSSPDDPINITDGIDMTVGRGMDIKNNIVTINLKNAPQSFDSDENFVHKYINPDGTIKFKEEDQFKVYLKYTDDMADVEDPVWSENTLTTPPETDLKGVYYLIEFGVVTDVKSTPIKIKCADKTYILFNKLLVRAFTKAQALNSPEAIQKVIRYSTESEKGQFLGTGSDPGVKYDVDARLDTETGGGDGSGEAGFIQTVRKAVSESGTVNADLVFPDIALAKVWKPVYEWINELSQIEYLNTGDELNDTTPIVYGRPFLYYVDEVNKFHWFETDNVVSETIVIGTTPGIYSYKLTNKVFDIVNFIVFRGGSDFYGKGTLDYEIDDTSTISNLKMRVVAMTDIAQGLIDREIKEGNLVADVAGAYTYGGNRYDRKTGPDPIALWDNTSYASDAAYNTALRKEILRLGKLRARSLISGLTDARYKGTMERKGVIQTVGALLDVTNTKTGQVNELIRAMDVRDIINKKGWFTTLSIEQDQKAIIAGDTT